MPSIFRDERATLASVRYGAILLMVSAALAVPFALVEGLDDETIVSAALGIGLGVTLWATRSRIVAVLILALMLYLISAVVPKWPMFFLISFRRDGCWLFALVATIIALWGTFRYAWLRQRRAIWSGVFRNGLAFLGYFLICETAFIMTMRWGVGRVSGQMASDAAVLTVLFIPLLLLILVLRKWLPLTRRPTHTDAVERMVQVFGD